MEKLQEKSTKHDINNRDLALCYIDGNILTGKTHSDIIKNYLGWDDTPNLIRRPESEEYSEDIFEIAFGHIIFSEKCVYIEEDSMENTEEDSVNEAVKRKFPEYIINYESMY